MFSFGSTGSSTTYGAILDVGSGSVGVGIVESNRDEKLPKLIYSHRELMRVNKEPVDRKEKLRQIREAFFSASLALSTEGLQQLAEYNKRAKIKRILITCASPWAHTVSRSVSYEHDKAIEVTSELIGNLEEKAEEKIEEELQQSSIAGKLGLHVVERATVSARINGYTVHEPRGLKGKSIELSHVVGLIPEEIIETIHEVQEKTLTGTKLSAHTFMLVNYCIIRDLLENTESLAIVDVTGESTEIGVVEDGVLKRSHHASCGSHTILRDVASGSGASAEHAMTLLRGYAEDTLESGDREKVEEYIRPFRNTLRDTLAEVHKTENIPLTLTITALPQLQPFFHKVIPSTFHEVSGMQCSVLNTTKEALRGMEVLQETDIFIALASRFFHKLHGCGEIDTF